MLFVYRFKHNGEMEEGTCQNSDAQKINGYYLFSICFRFFKTFCLEINGSAARIYIREQSRSQELARIVSSYIAVIHVDQTNMTIHIKF